MTMILELPTDLQSQVEQLALQRGTDAKTVVIEATRAGIGATFGGSTGGTHQSETRDERRARINKAIDEAQATFAHLSGPPFGDAVLEMEAAKRADVEREIARGL